MYGRAHRGNVVWITRPEGSGHGVAGCDPRRKAVAGGGESWLGRLGRWLREMRTWYRSRQALHDLQELSQAEPRLLRDIGLERADLWQAVRHGRIDGETRYRNGL